LGYKLFDHKRNKELVDIMHKQLKTTPKIDFVTQHRKNWKEHVHRMTPGRIPKIILKYQPKGNRCLGRPLKRWKDSVM
jgi:molybdopterin-guanine dinucleotide biosynthesis protein A